MSDIGNLTANLEVEGANQFAAEMQRAADTTKQTTVIIHEQRAAWSQLAASAVPAIGQVTSAGLSLAGTLAVIAHQKAMIATVTAPISAAGAAFWKYGSTALRVAAMVVPQLKAISIAASAIAITWKVVNSEFAKDVGSRVLKNVKTEVDTIRSSAAGLTDTIQTMASDGWNVVTTAVGNFAGEWGVASGLAAVATATIKAPLQGVAFALENLNRGAKVAQAGVTALAFTLSTGSTEGAAAFVAEGMAIRELAKETERVIALQESQRAGFQALRAIQDAAASSAARAAEIQRLSSLDTIEAIDNETRALQERAANLNLAGNLDEGKLKEIAELFAVIEQRKAAVLADGPQQQKESPVDAILRDAAQAIDLARGGQEEMAIATAIANGATADQVQQLRDLQAELQSVTAAREAAQQAEEQRAAAERQQQQLQQQGEERISALRDQLDLLNKSATNADIAMRELTRQGFSADQVAEIGRLTEEIDKLREQPEAAKTTGPTRANAAIRGSQEAAQIVLRGVGGQKNLEQLAQKQLNVQQQQLAALKSIQPQPMTVADF